MIKDQLFTEKYRPKTFDQIIGLKTKFTSKDKLPNLLLAGRCGIGKTTLAKVLAHEFDLDVLYLNASDERGIDVIRNKVKDFASTMSMNNKMKLVHFDEADGLTFDAQNTLRNIMEEYAGNCRFIFTCNNVGKIIEPIRSRCMEIDLSQPDREEITGYLMGIIDSEQMPMKAGELVELIKINYPDIRSMVNGLQHYKMFGVLPITSHVLAEQILDLVRKGDFTAARKEWIAASPDYRTLLLDITDQLTQKEIEKWIVTIAKYSFEMSMGSFPEISFAACLKVMSDGR